MRHLTSNQFSFLIKPDFSAQLNKYFKLQKFAEDHHSNSSSTISDVELKNSTISSTIYFFESQFRERGRIDTIRETDQFYSLKLSHQAQNAFIRFFSFSITEEESDFFFCLEHEFLAALQPSLASLRSYDLTSLNIENNSSFVANLHCFADFRKLRYFNFSNTKIYGSFRSLSKLSKLRYVGPYNTSVECDFVLLDSDVLLTGPKDSILQFSPRLSLTDLVLRKLTFFRGWIHPGCPIEKLQIEIETFKLYNENFVEATSSRANYRQLKFLAENIHINLTKNIKKLEAGGVPKTALPQHAKNMLDVFSVFETWVISQIAEHDKIINDYIYDLFFNPEQWIAKWLNNIETNKIDRFSIRKFEEKTPQEYWTAMLSEITCSVEELTLVKHSLGLEEESESVIRQKQVFNLARKFNFLANELNAKFSELFELETIQSFYTEEQKPRIQQVSFHSYDRGIFYNDVKSIAAKSHDVQQQIKSVAAKCASLRTILAANNRSQFMSKLPRSYQQKERNFKKKLICLNEKLIKAKEELVVSESEISELRNSQPQYKQEQNFKTSEKLKTFLLICFFFVNLCYYFRRLIRKLINKLQNFFSFSRKG